MSCPSISTPFCKKTLLINEKRFTLTTHRYGMIRRGLRYLGGGVVALTAGTAAIFVPPIEALPAPLVHYRVTCEGLGRLCRCVGVGLATVYEFKWKLPHDATPEQWEAAHSATAQRLTTLAETNGGMYIKTGQAFAAQNHLLPPTYARVMNKLHDAVLNRPIGEIFYVLEQELKRPVAEVFAAFDETAVAAASLAQVHRARLRATGEDVAVKVQYIDIHQRYDGDFAVILLMLRISGAIFPGYDFGTLVRQTDRTLRAELDFGQEADNLERCHRDLQREFGTDVVCPRLFREVSTTRVMVTEFVDGCRADAVDRMRVLGVDPRDVGRLLSDTFAYQLFRTGFVHADPHPGNILVRRNPDGSGRAQCVLLDHGLAFTLTPEERKVLAEVWTCCASHDTPGLRAVMRKLGLNDGDDDYKIFGSVWLQYPYDLYDPNATHAKQDHVALMREGANRTMPVVTQMLEKLPNDFVMALRNISTYRSVHKRMGNPVSRAGRMLRYSIVAARSERVGWFAMQVALWQLWWGELKVRLAAAWLRMMHPELVAEIDDVLTVG